MAMAAALGFACGVSACGGGGQSETSSAETSSPTLSAYSTADELLAAVEAQGIECGKRVSREGLRPAIDGVVCVRPENSYNWMTIRVSMYSSAEYRDEGTFTLADNIAWEHDNADGGRMSYRAAYKNGSWLAGKDWIVEITDYAVDDALATVNQLAETIGGVPNLGGPGM
jgi:hypothetical protein